MCSCTRVIFGALIAALIYSLLVGCALTKDPNAPAVEKHYKVYKMDDLSLHDVVVAECSASSIPSVRRCK